MRTTVDIPDELFRLVKARAAMEGMKMKELIEKYVARGLEHERVHTNMSARLPLSEQHK